MKFKVRINKEPLEEYLNALINEILSSNSEMAIQLFKQDITHRAIWIEPSNNISKLVDLDYILEEGDGGVDIWYIDLTLNPVNVHEKRMEIVSKFDNKPRDLRVFDYDEEEDKY